jgi:DnaJ-class molecular chaperone
VARDYYVILGVAPDATQEQIKSAYRQKAKELHPDCSGGDREPFQTILEAYEVLGDPIRRRDYDSRLARRKHVSHTARGVHAKWSRPRRSPAEPLVPTDQSWFSTDQWVNEPRHSLSDAPWHRQERPDDVVDTQSDTLEAVHVVVELTWQQARVGGRASIWIPVQSPCPVCLGHGRTRFYLCQECSGYGLATEEYPLSISFPAGVRDGSTTRMSLEELGMGHTILFIHFWVHG